ncbi:MULTISPECIES: AzlC family ABC transporter permease [Pseudovibrio]|uniref:AzlC family ABC transporter permease n=1 Tax=Stappiaceae TaxID=2821832 RepID=UPI00236694B3|nr:MULTISPECIES: AzlC family ABC transporter permease [Pseudovibrio]MDD7910338.1 AzlC family ABC transporter permease [Pseudovibrio exalbescens]MDX5594053.1 AzlC family ABC transporter permease [Pseudovibrio sp. SPO723]
MTDTTAIAKPSSPARDDYLAGMKTIAPLLLVAGPIGVLFGTLAAQKGLSPFEIMLQSALVFAGGSQFVALDMWAEPLPWLTIALSTLLVNLRHVLMSTSLTPNTAQFSAPQRFVAFFFLADEVWALSEKRALKHGLTFSFYMGLVVPFYLMWVLSSFVGAFLGSAFTDPASIGLDFAFTALFICLVMSFWNGIHTGAVLAASGLTAALVHATIPGAWYIMAGAAAGMATAALLARPDNVENRRTPEGLS